MVKWCVDKDLYAEEFLKYEIDIVKWLECSSVSWDSDKTLWYMEYGTMDGYSGDGILSMEHWRTGSNV